MITRLKQIQTPMIRRYINWQINQNNYTLRIESHWLILAHITDTRTWYKSFHDILVIITITTNEGLNCASRQSRQSIQYSHTLDMEVNDVQTHYCTTGPTTYTNEPLSYGLTHTLIMLLFIIMQWPMWICFKQYCKLNFSATLAYQGFKIDTFSY